MVIRYIDESIQDNDETLLEFIVEAFVMAVTIVVVAVPEVFF